MWRMQVFACIAAGHGPTDRGRPRFRSPRPGRAPRHGPSSTNELSTFRRMTAPPEHAAHPPRLRPRWPGQFMVEMSRDPLQLFRRLARDHGDVVAIGAGGRTFVIVAHPELAREVLVTQQR